MRQEGDEGKRLWGSLMEGTDYGLGVIANGDILIACGQTSKSNLPEQSNSNAYHDPDLELDAGLIVGQDIFFMGFDHAGNKNYATYFGGDDEDLPHRIFYSNGYFYTVGVTQAWYVDIPLWQPTLNSYFQNDSYPNPDYFFSSGFISKFGINFAPVGIEELSSKNATIFVFPNPTSDYFTILSTEEIGTASPFYSLFDGTGNLIEEGAISAFPFQLKISNLASGLYLLRVINNHKTYYQKIIKQ